MAQGPSRKYAGFISGSLFREVVVILFRTGNGEVLISKHPPALTNTILNRPRGPIKCRSICLGVPAQRLNAEPLLRFIH